MLARRPRRWRVNTRGSFQSEQAHRGEEFLAKTDTAHLPRDWTLLFEIVCPESKVVVRYDFEGLRMLAAYETVKPRALFFVHTTAICTLTSKHVCRVSTMSTLTDTHVFCTLSLSLCRCM